MLPARHDDDIEKKRQKTISKLLWLKTVTFYIRVCHGKSSFQLQTLKKKKKTDVNYHSQETVKTL